MNYDHDAIYKAYPNEQLEIVDGKGIFKLNTSCTETFSVDQSLVDAARVELDKLEYKYQRELEYPDWKSQLDYIYHNGIDKWKTDIVDPVKAKYPKPS
mgnify:FL=1